MTISSSLNAGVAGLAANANRLATISDNIANSATHGYKRVETDFHSMVIASGSGKYSAGGVRASTQRMIDQPGTLVGTSSATDIAISGRGFVPVTDLGSIGLDGTGVPMRLATTGSFKLDDEGYLRTPGGVVLMGVKAGPDGTIPPFARETTTSLAPIQVLKNQFVGEPTTSVGLGINLPATDEPTTPAEPTRQLSVEYFDALGMPQSLSIKMEPLGTVAPPANREWNIKILDSATLNAGAPAIVGEYTVPFQTSGDHAGKPGTVAETTGAGIDVATGVATIPVNNNQQEIKLNFGAPNTNTGLTQLSNIYAPTGITKDGAAVGNMTGIEIDDGGHVIANFDTGVSRVLYQVPVIDVGNPNQLTALDNQTYAQSAASGGFFMWDAGDGPTGDIVSYALEGSTTDVAGELTNLIQTQRAYSSNAKVIQTVDEMLQETTNIKR